MCVCVCVFERERETIAMHKHAFHKYGNHLNQPLFGMHPKSEYIVTRRAFDRQIVSYLP